MDEEKKFENKSFKKVVIIAIVILLVALIVAGVLFYLNGKNKPEKIFEDKIEQVFELTETKNESEEINSGRLSLELSGEINSDLAEIKTINPIIKAVKINSITEFDMNKNIFNQNLSASYDGDEVVNLDALLQDERIYVHLNELYSKYIELTDLLESELGTEFDLNSLFETNAEFDVDALIKDIKEILIEEVSKLDLEQEKVELNGDKVRKTTAKLYEKDIYELIKRILNKFNEYQYTEELEELIKDLDSEIEYVDEDSGNYIEISMYTKGLKNDIVKLEAKVFKYDEESMSIEFNKENDNKTVITAESEGALVKLTIEKNSDKETVLSLAYNEDVEYPEEEIEVMKITINEQNENEGTIELAINVEEVELILNVKYKLEKNIEIEKRNTSNSINAEDFTQEDVDEILTNVQENEILYGILEMMGAFDTTTDDYYEYEDEYVDDYISDYEYIY